MLSMVVVMISMSMASIRRISEVLNEKADLTDPEDPVMAVSDGQIDFNHVNFSYKHGSGKNALSDIDLHIKSGEDYRSYRRHRFRKEYSGESDLPSL